MCDTIATAIGTRLVSNVHSIINFHRFRRRQIMLFEKYIGNEINFVFTIKLIVDKTDVLIKTLKISHIFRIIKNKYDFYSNENDKTIFFSSYYNCAFSANSVVRSILTSPTKTKCETHKMYTQINLYSF